MKEAKNYITTDNLEIQFVTEMWDDLEQKKFDDAYKTPKVFDGMGGVGGGPPDLKELGLRSPGAYILVRPAGSPEDAPFSRIEGIDLEILQVLFRRLGASPLGAYHGPEPFARKLP